VLPPVAMLQPHQHMTGGAPAPRAVLMSTGKVVPTVTLRIIDEAGRDLPRGQIGQVLVKSPTLFRGYWKRPDLSAQTIRDGYLYTGDMGMVSADGYLTLYGRKPDLVQRDGRVIYPRIVEEALHDHPAVKEASLVQVGARVVMAVSLRRDWRDLPPADGWDREFRRHLAHRVEAWQLPDVFELFEELPRSPLGKVLRREVRAALEAGAPPA
jgi:acyl-CoA synthetase (AMP-forming)/AMP-acid ligase II